MSVRRALERNMKRNELMNHAVHKTELLRPMTFMASLSRSSFSRTMVLMIMENEYTHERTMNIGNDSAMVTMNLKRTSQIRGRQTGDSSTIPLDDEPHEVATPTR